MSLTLTYPGVYIQELPSAVRTIVGVSTSITAFIGHALQGPVNEPETINNWGDYERVFGGLWKKSSMSYAVNQYFTNGGKTAVIVRVVKSDAKKAQYELDGSQLKLEASNEGLWGSYLTIKIDHDVDPDKFKEDDTIFNLSVTDKKTGNFEEFRNLSTKEDSSMFIKNVLKEESDLIRVLGDVPSGPPPADTFKYVDDSASDGGDIGADELKGSETNKTGVYALEKADLFNLLCIPPPKIDGDVPDAVYTAALDYCDKRRAMLILDPPSGWKDKNAAKNNFDTVFGSLKHKNAVLYFPRIKAPNPVDEYRLGEFVPCGVVAGVIARTDGERGVWKSAAGIETTMAGVSDLTVKLTDDENGELNPLGINCLRILPPAGIVVWGARTMRGADRLADQWKYLAVRRMALYIEESLYRGTQWVVFEPNDEKLWAQIRLNVGAFMHDLFRKGAFQGTDPKKAYFVRCDSETTTQYDIDRGIVNIVVGFAPLKPAEFVVLKIQQIAGQESE